MFFPHGWFPSISNFFPSLIANFTQNHETSNMYQRQWWFGAWREVLIVVIEVNFTQSSVTFLLIKLNPANQLRLVVYPIMYRVFIHSRWLAGFLPSTVSLPDSFLAATLEGGPKRLVPWQPCGRMGSLRDEVEQLITVDDGKCMKMDLKIGSWKFFEFLIVSNCFVLQGTEMYHHFNMVFLCLS